MNHLLGLKMSHRFFFLFTICYLGDRPLVHKGANQRLHVFVQLLQHVWLREVNRGSVIHIQTVGYCIVAPYVKRESKYYGDQMFDGSI